MKLDDGVFPQAFPHCSINTRKDEEGVFFSEKTFSFFQKLSIEFREGGKMPFVAGIFVNIFLQRLLKKKFQFRKRGIPIFYGISSFMELPDIPVFTHRSFPAA